MCSERFSNKTIAKSAASQIALLCINTYTQISFLFVLEESAAKKSFTVKCTYG